MLAATSGVMFLLKWYRIIFTATCRGLELNLSALYVKSWRHGVEAIHQANSDTGTIRRWL
jgi:hypothetical protein